MNSKVITLDEDDFSKFSFDGNCAATIRITEITGRPSATIRVSDANLINIETECINGLLNVYAKSKNSIGRAEFVNGLRDAVAKDSISGFLSALVSGAIKKSGNEDVEITITLGIPSNFVSLEVTADNATIEVEHTAISTIFVRAANLDFISRKPLAVNSLTIKSANADIDFMAGEGMELVRIEGANSDIVIRRSTDYKGIIKASGGNIHASGDLSGNASFGMITCNVDNGDVSVISI